jgi:hypothetical protein
LRPRKYLNRNFGNSLLGVLAREKHAFAPCFRTTELCPSLSNSDRRCSLCCQSWPLLESKCTSEASTQVRMRESLKHGNRSSYARYCTTCAKTLSVLTCVGDYLRGRFVAWPSEWGLTMTNPTNTTRGHHIRISLLYLRLQFISKLFTLPSRSCNHLGER